MCHFGLSLPIYLKLVGGITSHLGHKVILGSSIVSDFALEMAPCDLELLGGGASAGRPFSFELKTLGEKVGYCQSLPSDFVLLGTSFSVY